MIKNSYENNELSSQIDADTAIVFNSSDNAIVFNSSDNAIVFDSSDNTIVFNSSDNEMQAVSTNFAKPFNKSENKLISIRLPQEMLKQLRCTTAIKGDLSYQQLIKMYIAEGLSKDKQALAVYQSDQQGYSLTTPNASVSVPTITSDYSEIFLSDEPYV